MIKQTAEPHIPPPSLTLPARGRENNARRRGFTLIEIAIVFGIAGLILGAVWVAYNRVRTNNQIHLAEQELTTIANNVRSIYSERGTIQGYEDTLTIAMDNLHVFPSEMESSTLGQVFNPWSSATFRPYSNANPIGSVSVNAGSYTALCSGSNFKPQNPTNASTPVPTTCFAVTFYNVPSSACAQLLFQTSQPDFSSNLLGISLNTVAGTATTYTTLALAATACSPTAPPYIVWFFAVK